MGDFKVGDKVRCVRVFSGTKRIEVGKEYTVCPSSGWGGETGLYFKELRNGPQNFSAAQFELVKPTLDLKKPLKTQDGRGVRFLDTLIDGSIVGIVKCTASVGEFAYTWRKDGSPQVGSLPGLQLVNVLPPKKKLKRWLFLYEYTYAGGRTELVEYLSSSSDPHLAGTRRKCIAKKEVTITEGEGMGSDQQGCQGNCTSSCKCA